MHRKEISSLITQVTRRWAVRKLPVLFHQLGASGFALNKQLLRSWALAPRVVLKMPSLEQGHSAWTAVPRQPLLA